MERDLYKTIIQTSIDGFWIMDMQGNILDVNDAYCRMIGYSREELLKMRIPDVEAVEKPEEVSAHIRRIEEAGRDHFETKHRHKDGRMIDVEISLNYMKTTDQIFIFAHDVTERKKAEAELRDSEERFRTIFDNVNDGMLLADVAVKKFYIGNNAICQMLGYSLEEIKNLGIADIHPKEDLPYVMEQAERQIRREIALAKDLPVKRKDGSVFYADVNTSLVTLAGRKYLLGIFRDITERKKIEEAILKTNRCFLTFGPTAALNIKNIVETAGSVLEGTCALYNKEEEELLCTTQGWNIPGDFDTEDKKQGHICYDVIKKAADVPLVINDLEKTPYANTDPNVLKYKLKAYIGCAVKVNNKPVGSLCVVFQQPKSFTQNETEILSILAKAIGIEEERRQADEELAEAYLELKHAQEQLIQSSKMAAMGQLAAGISHELNQPLTGIKGFAQAALMEIEEKSPLTDDLAQIVEQADRMDRIIKNVRFFARKADFKFEEVEINKPIEDAFMFFNEQLKVHNIKVIKHFAKNLPKISADSNQLQQVFLNLLTNAKDAIDVLKRPDGGKITLKTSLTKDRKYIRIIFKDMGCGMPKENQQSVFNPFFTTKSPDGGIGLGLAIVYRIIENHRGTISFKSVEGKGTMFKILLPVGGGYR